MGKWVLTPIYLRQEMILRFIDMHAKISIRVDKFWQLEQDSVVMNLNYYCLELYLDYLRREIYSQYPFVEELLQAFQQGPYQDPGPVWKENSQNKLIAVCNTSNNINVYNTNGFSSHNAHNFSRRI